MTAGEFCNRTVVICRPDDPLVEAARRMRDFHVGSIVVVEESEEGVRRPIGVVTDRDLVVGAIADGDSNLERPVAQLMSPKIVTAIESETLEDCLNRMRAFGVRRLPVVDKDGGLQGLITFDDLVAQLATELNDLSSLVDRELKKEEHEVEGELVH